MSDPRFLQEGFDPQLAHLVEEIGEALVEIAVHVSDMSAARTILCLVVVKRMGDVLAAAGKTQRWGPFSVNPLLSPDQQEINLAWLFRALAQMEEAIDRLGRSVMGEALARELADVKQATERFEKTALPLLNNGKPFVVEGAR